MDVQEKILVTGSSGMIGSAVLRRLRQTHQHLLTPSHAELDLRNQAQVQAYFAAQQPAYVFHLAAIVGGIEANHTYPATFIYDNTQMHCNLIQAAKDYQVKKILFPGSACTYPKLAPQPIPTSAFLDGQIEVTNIAYAAAKINGIVMCQSYAKQHQLSAIIPMPTNAYGINDNFDPQRSHVIPGLMTRFHQAKIEGLSKVTLWGSGSPLREFIYVDDLADAFIFLMQHYHSHELINVGSQEEISIAELAEKIAAVVGFKGQIHLDTSKPDGAPRKCLDSQALFAMGFKPQLSLDQGLERMYAHHF